MYINSVKLNKLLFFYMQDKMSAFFCKFFLFILGISRKLEVAAQKRAAGDIRPWIKGIVNHTYWVAASCGEDRTLKVAKWKSVTNHIINKHVHDSELFSRCEHEELEERAWLIEGLSLLSLFLLITYLYPIIQFI